MDDLQLVWSIGAIAFVFKVFDWLTTPKPPKPKPEIPEGFEFAIGDPVYWIDPNDKEAIPAIIRGYDGSDRYVIEDANPIRQRLDYKVCSRAAKHIIARH